MARLAKQPIVNPASRTTIVNQFHDSTPHTKLSSQRRMAVSGMDPYLKLCCFSQLVKTFLSVYYNKIYRKSLCSLAGSVLFERQLSLEQRDEPCVFQSLITFPASAGISISASDESLLPAEPMHEAWKALHRNRHRIDFPYPYPATRVGRTPTIFRICTDARKPRPVSMAVPPVSEPDFHAAEPD